MGSSRVPTLLGFQGLLGRRGWVDRVAALDVRRTGDICNLGVGAWPDVLEGGTKVESCRARRRMSRVRRHDVSSTSYDLKRDRAFLLGTANRDKRH